MIWFKEPKSIEPNLTDSVESNRNQSIQFNLNTTNLLNPIHPHPNHSNPKDPTKLIQSSSIQSHPNDSKPKDPTEPIQFNQTGQM